MLLTPGKREHLFDAVETPGETGAEGEAFRAEIPGRPLRLIESLQACTKDLVDDLFERDAASMPLPFEPRRHVIVDGQVVRTS
jgi:hypothetical protein